MSITEVVIAVPALYLIPSQEYIKANAKSSSPKIELAAQNVYSEEKGAFTGEISPHMLVDASINWTLIGHSERRTLFKDTSELVAKKTKAALSQGLKVVLCIGETLEERDADKTMAVCEGMTGAVVKAIKEEDWKNVVIAYEPGPSPHFRRIPFIAWLLRSDVGRNVYSNQSGPSAPARSPLRSRPRTSTPSSASSSPPRSRRRLPTRSASSSASLSKYPT